MDASEIFPLGFHPLQQYQLPDMSGPSPKVPRECCRVRYYYIDYDISSYFPPDEASSKKVVGILGRDREVPELSPDVPYDPFKVDIFIIGNMFHQEFSLVCIPFTALSHSPSLNGYLQKYSNADFLKPLIDAMKATDPAARPTAKEALQRWEDIRKNISTLQRFSRIRPRDESWLMSGVGEVERVRSLILQGAQNLIINTMDSLS